MSYPYKMEENNIAFWEDKNHHPPRADFFRAYNELFYTADLIRRTSGHNFLPVEVQEELRRVADEIQGMALELDSVIPGFVQAETR